ncbi:hypothetical protein IG631_17232 [Alternaria alternata]|nr:hypothetical protein IG631_17232 [Alternaria alternata]
MLVFRGSATTKRAAPRQYLELTGWESQDDCGMDQEKSRCPRDTPNSQVFGPVDVMLNSRSRAGILST